MWSYEEKAALSGFLTIAGVDEAGRGPLAGPVVSAAVVLPVDFPSEGITDSKKLSPGKRDRLYDRIVKKAIAVGVGMAEPEEIDTINILQASLLSMERAVHDLHVIPDYLLIDGIFTISYDAPQEAIKKGDMLSISIASASIVAKVTRDRIMKSYDLIYPDYGLAGHKGYPTKNHKDAIAAFGVSPIHRKSFKGVKEYL
ncbi:MAG: ribonuclease HII [Proteobacteria bacterium]|nr:ribonuclease HII [Pseudomonadota bacterium]